MNLLQDILEREKASYWKLKLEISLANIEASGFIQLVNARVYGYLEVPGLFFGCFFLASIIFIWYVLWCYIYCSLLRIYLVGGGIMCSHIFVAGIENLSFGLSICCWGGGVRIISTRGHMTQFSFIHVQEPFICAKHVLATLGSSKNIWYNIFDAGTLLRRM